MLNDTLISARQQLSADQKDSIIYQQAELIKQLEQRCKHYEESHDLLYQQLLELRRKVFGSQSERYIDADPEAKQPSLLDDNDFFAEAEAKGAIMPEPEIEVSAHSRKKKGVSTKELPRQVVTIKIPEQEMLCSCGACKQVFKTEVKEILHYVPAVFGIIEQHREVASCPVCKDGIVTAAAPHRYYPK